MGRLKLLFSGIDISHSLWGLNKKLISILGMNLKRKKNIRLGFLAAAMLWAPSLIYSETANPGINETLAYLNKWINKIGLSPSSKNCAGCKSILSVSQDGSLLFEYITLKSRLEQKIPAEWVNIEGLELKKNSKEHNINLSCQENSKCVKLEYYQYESDKSQMDFQNSFLISLQPDSPYGDRVYNAFRYLIREVKRQYRKPDPFAQK